MTKTNDIQVNLTAKDLATDKMLDGALAVEITLF